MAWICFGISRYEMNVKIVAAIITFVLSIAICVVIFAVMLVAMNGFSESDANWGILLYLILALMTTVLMSVGAAIFAGRLGKRSIHVAIIVLSSSSVFTLIGAVLLSLSALAGIVAADIVRRNF